MICRALHLDKILYNLENNITKWISFPVLKQFPVSQYDALVVAKVSTNRLKFVQ